MFLTKSLTLNHVPKLLYVLLILGAFNVYPISTGANLIRINVKKKIFFWVWSEKNAISIILQSQKARPCKAVALSITKWPGRKLK